MEGVARVSASCFADLMYHVGHHIVVVTYGDPPHNVAVECEDCNEVLMDFDEPEEPYWDGGVDPVLAEQTTNYLRSL